MNKYKLIYQTRDGNIRDIIVDAANRVMAFELFYSMEIADVIAVECFRLLNENEK